jgi:hypothetical protein
MEIPLHSVVITGFPVSHLITGLYITTVNHKVNAKKKVVDTIMSL